MRRPEPSQPGATGWHTVAFRLAASAAIVVAVTAVISLVQSEIPPRSLEVLYMPAVLSIAVLWGFAYALGSSIGSALAFDWYFLPPTHRFFFHASDVAAVAILIACTLIVSELSSRAHTRARSSERALALIAEEQAALRRVATLVAREGPTAEVFETVCAEVGEATGAAAAYLLRWERDGAATVVASWARHSAQLPLGARYPDEETSIAGLIQETGGPAHLLEPEGAGGGLSSALRALGIRFSAGAPVVAGGRPWGMMAIGSAESEPGPRTRERLADFSELVSTAISNAEARSELQASRTRIVAAADAERRRVERDLHDGAQQRLVALALELRGVELSLSPSQRELRGRLDRVARELGVVLDELREISRGIHPSLLSDRGLKAAVRSLARRSPLPVEVHAATDDQRFPEVIEVAAYYVVSEALVNAAKHSGASVVHVELEADGQRLALHIRDDGIGGAEPGRGSGLVGMADRAGALGGRFLFSSPPGGGTTLLVEFPLGAAGSLANSAPQAADTEGAAGANGAAGAAGANGAAGAARPAGGAGGLVPAGGASG